MRACLAMDVYFKNFDSIKKPGQGIKSFGEIEMPVYIRNCDYYDRIMERYGLKKMMERYPPFDDSFKKTYPDYMPNKVPEYMILGYEKNK